MTEVISVDFGLPVVLTIEVPGMPGPSGSPGTVGPTGPANTLTIGTVSTLSAGASATAGITGSAPNQTLNLGIPTGSTGPANTLTIGTVTTAAAGGTASATITGSAPNQTLNLTIPTGSQGPAGSGAADATTTTKGSVQLAGDLGGTAAAPTVLLGTNHTHTATQISNSTAVGRSVLIAVDAAAARTAIGAGTSNLAIGTTSTTAKAGDYAPADATTIAKGIVQLAGDLAGTAAAPTVPGLTGKANTTLTLTAGTGLTGGGDLSANRTFTVSYGSAAGTAVQGNDTRVVADQAAATASIRTIGTGALQAAAGNHTHTGLTADDIATNASIRTIGTGALQAAAGNHTHSGLTADQAAGTASVRTIGTGALQAAAGNHTHVAANITDSTTVGRSLLTAVDAPTARAATGAAPVFSFSATKTASYTAVANEIAVMNVAGGGTALTLPAAPTDKMLVGFRAIGATTAVPLTITRGGTATIGDSGATSVTEPMPGVTRIFQYDAGTTSWVTISDVKTLSALDARFAALTHTHVSTSITDFVEATQDVVGAAVVAGTNMTVTYNDATGLITLDSNSPATTVATLPSGTTLTVLKAAGVWPARPTSRSDIVVAWKGADPDPAIVSTGTGGMLDNVDYRLVTP